jgi:hypothetical protein
MESVADYLLALAEGQLHKLLKAGDISHEEIGNTPDFALLFVDETYRKVVEAGGYGEAICALERGY